MDSILICITQQADQRKTLNLAHLQKRLSDEIKHKDNIHLFFFFM